MQAPELPGATDSRNLKPLILQQESYLTELETDFSRIEERKCILTNFLIWPLRILDQSIQMAMAHKNYDL